MLNEAQVAELYVESVGEGRPLVLLHGWALHGGLFAPLLPALARRHRVHVADLPGHGFSAPPRSWSLDAIVEALERRFAGREPTLDVLGWSLGGALALRWARRHPNRIGKLVLVATTPKFVATDDWPHAMSARTLSQFTDELRVAYKATLTRFVTLQVQGTVAGRATLATLRHQLFARGEPDPAALGEALAMLRELDVRGDVHDVRAPALVVAGERDTLAPLQASEWLAGALPEARLFSIPGAAHAPFLSHRDAFTAAVLAFLGHG